MIYAVYETSTGIISYVTSTSVETISGYNCVMVPDEIRDNTHYIVDGNPVAYSEIAKEAIIQKPIGHFSWSPTEGKWIDNRSLSEILNSKWNEVKRIRDEKFNTVKVSSQGIAFQISKDRENLTSVLTGFVATGASPETTISWRDALNNIHNTTFSSLKAFGLEVLQHGENIYNYSWTLWNSMMIITNAEELKAFDVDVGWPS